MLAAGNVKSEEEATEIILDNLKDNYKHKLNDPKLSIDEIREIIKPVGLSPAKSKGIWGLSKILIDKHQGKVPKNLEDLEDRVESYYIYKGYEEDSSKFEKMDRMISYIEEKLESNNLLEL